MWRTGITIGLGWLALLVGVVFGIIYFIDGDWVAGAISLAAGAAVLAVAVGAANALTRTVNQ